MLNEVLLMGEVVGIQYKDNSKYLDVRTWTYDKTTGSSKNNVITVVCFALIASNTNWLEIGQFVKINGVVSQYLDRHTGRNTQSIVCVRLTILEWCDDQGD